MQGSSQKQESNTQLSNKKSNMLGLVQENISSFFTDSTSRPSFQESVGRQENCGITESTKPPNAVTVADASISNQQTNFMMDKIVERFITMALPATIDEISTERIQRRIDLMEPRPNLSVQIMSRNFIQLNSRLSSPFELLNDVVSFFNWRNPKLTMSWLMITTNLIIYPSYSVILALLVLVLVPMSQSFYQIYQPLSDPITNPGPLLNLPAFPVRNPHFIKPPTEFTREFLINVTDLQNHMLIYINAWNFVTYKLINRFGNFSNELISSVLFLFFLLFALMFYLFMGVFETLIPVFKLSLITFLWLGVCSFHPRNKDFIFDFLLSEELRIKLQKTTNNLEKAFNSEFVFNHSTSDISYEIEVFEVQKLNEKTNEWGYSKFSNDPLTYTSFPRLTHSESYVGNISKIKPPRNFEFGLNTKWNIDLQSPEIWLQTQLIDEQTVRFDVDTKWVYDTPQEIETATLRRRRWIRTAIGCSFEDELLDSKIENNPTTSGTDV